MEQTTLSIISALREGSILVYFIVFCGGAILSLGACSIVRIPLVFGYVGGTSTSKFNTLLTVSAFILGLIFSYVLVGIFLGVFSSILNYLFDLQTYAYYFLGGVCLIMAVYLIGLIKFNLPTFSINSNLKFSGVFGAFILGIIFVFFEGVVCPCCGPLLYVITTYTLVKGKFIYGILLFLCYALGQSLPLFLIGAFAAGIKTINIIHRNLEYVEVGSGLILLLLGIYFIIIA